MKMRNKTAKSLTIMLAVLAMGFVGVFSRAADEPAEKPKDQAKNPGFAALQSLAGTWVSTKPLKDDEKPSTVSFKSVSRGSAIIESMFPGSNFEMVNVYTSEGNSVVMTHYCAMGNQPRLRLSSAENGVLKFEYVDGGNIKSRDSMHMDSLEIIIKDDLLTEKWTSYAKGKDAGTSTFEFKREKK